MNLKINGTEYPLIAAYATGTGAEFQFRNAFLISVEMDWQTAHELFVDGVNWSTVAGNTETDRSDYCVAGKITDHRNGRIDVLMGQKTAEEKLRDETEAESERILPILRRVLPSLDDEEALSMAAYFPEWDSGKSVIEGERLLRNGELWRARQSHTTQAGWEPENAPTLWERVALPSEAGTQDDPIAYTPGMELEEGKYYSEDGVLYLCIRDTGVPVYNPLSALVGIYVEVA